MKKNFTELHVDSRSENEKVHMLNKYFRDNQNVDQDFWIYIDYEKIIQHFENFNNNDLHDLIKDFYYWNSDDLWILAEMFAFIEDYDLNDRLKRINATEFYCTLFICTNESDSNDLLVNLNYILAKNKNLSEEILYQIELKLITLKKSDNRIQPEDLFEKTLQYIEQIKNSR